MEPLKLPKLQYGHLLQLLHCADVHSQGSFKIDEKYLLNVNEMIQTINPTHQNKSSASLQKKSIPLNGKELSSFMKCLTPEIQKYFLCSRPDVVSIPCTQCNSSITPKEPEETEKMFLEFKEKPTFTAFDDFSKKWTKNMERYAPCSKCKKENHSPIYFLEWPQYLLVHCTSLGKFPPGIASFTIGNRSKVEYNLIGAVVVHKPILNETRNTTVLFGNSWYICYGDKFQTGKGEKRNLKVEAIKDPFRQACTNVEILLYARQKEYKVSDPKKETAKKEVKGSKVNAKIEQADGLGFHITEPEESYKPKEREDSLRKKKEAKQDTLSVTANLNTTKVSSIHRSTEILQKDVAEQRKEKAQEKENKKANKEANKEANEEANEGAIEEANEGAIEIFFANQAPVLRLPNKGNSCWIAACCQLVYCAHTRSNNQAFSFSSTSVSPVIKELSAMMSNSKNSKNAWKKFYANLFSNISAMEDYEHKQGDVGQFYEWLIEHIEPEMTEDSKKFLFCSDIHPTSEGCDCTTEKQPAIDKPSVPFLQYAGIDDFSSSKEFSEEWKICFEYEGCCDWCGKDNIFKNYFQHWPKYLFVLTSSSVELFKSALQYKFTVGENVKATYAVIGAAIHAGENASAGHYVALVKSRDDAWHLCSDAFSRAMDPHKVQGDVQLLLFEKDEQNESEAKRKKEKKAGSGDQSKKRKETEANNNEIRRSADQPKKKDKDEKKDSNKQEKLKHTKEEKTYEVAETNQKQTKPKRGNEINKGMGRQLT